MQTIDKSLTSTQVLAMSTAVTIATLSTNSRIARVPRYLIVYKPAGTAYTVDAACRFKITDDDGNLLFDVPCLGFFDQATAQGRYVEPATSGRAFNANSITFLASTNMALTTGDSALYIRLGFEEFPLVLA